MKIRRRNVIYWLRTNSFELFPWYYSKGWSGFFRLFNFELCWYPSFCEEEMKPWEYERRKRLATLYHR